MIDLTPDEVKERLRRYRVFERVAAVLFGFASSSLAVKVAIPRVVTDFRCDHCQKEFHAIPERVEGLFIVPRSFCAACATKLGVQRAE